jgi:beta-lactamase superfamily II metal-dependent hydrolase
VTLQKRPSIIGANLSEREFVRFLTIPILCLLASCSGDAAGPVPTPPTITVLGVESGAVYSGPVTITVEVDRGSYSVTLNNEPFVSGRTVSQIGSHVLRVEARSGGAISTREVQFSIGAGNRLLIVRLLDLGPNDSGGGGDAILITDSTAGGKVHALIDAGPAGAGGADAGFVARRLAALGVDSLAMLQLTHAHGDHYLGMSPIISATRIRRFVYNGQVRNLASYNTAVNAARAKADSTIIPANPYAFQLNRDDAAPTITVLPPLPTYLGASTDDGDLINEGSLGTQLRIGTFEMFFTGDGEVEANNRWRTTFASYTADVDALKVGHHGANNAVFDNGFNGASSWLAHTSPTTSVISANGVTHPRINALTRILQQANNRTYCTNVHGEIEIRVTAAGTHSVVVQKNASMDCVPGSTATT